MNGCMDVYSMGQRKSLEGTRRASSRDDGSPYRRMPRMALISENRFS